jgi:NAD+-dependent secondary alcohol dehydrogenase Adh1
MKALRLHEYGQAPRLDDVPEPIITGPHDVIVKVAGAGLCRTDVHIRDGWFAAAVPVDLPLTLGHENTGWVHEVGSAVETVGVGDAVICHPQLSCGLCPACRIGDDMRCAGAGLHRAEPGRRVRRVAQDQRPRSAPPPGGPGAGGGRAAR